MGERGVVLAWGLSGIGRGRPFNRVLCTEGDGEPQSATEKEDQALRAKRPNNVCAAASFRSTRSRPSVALRGPLSSSVHKMRSLPRHRRRDGRSRGGTVGLCGGDAGGAWWPEFRGMDKRGVALAWGLSGIGRGRSFDRVLCTENDGEPRSATEQEDNALRAKRPNNVCAAARSRSTRLRPSVALRGSPSPSVVKFGRKRRTGVAASPPEPTQRGRAIQTGQAHD